VTYEYLVEFPTRKMSMKYDYQPVVIGSLVDAGATATVRQVSAARL
jgi:hypothetical protein